MFELWGFPVVLDASLTEWEFPNDPFIEYEPKDEGWCRRLGIGREGPAKVMYRVGDTFVCHPAMFQRICKQMDLEIRPNHRDMLELVPTRSNRVVESMMAKCLDETFLFGDSIATAIQEEVSTGEFTRKSLMDSLAMIPKDEFKAPFLLRYPL